MAEFVLRELHGKTLKTGISGPGRRNVVDLDRLGIAAVLARRGRSFDGGIKS